MCNDIGVLSDGNFNDLGCCYLSLCLPSSLASQNSVCSPNSCSSSNALVRSNIYFVACCITGSAVNVEPESNQGLKQPVNQSINHSFTVGPKPPITIARTTLTIKLDGDCTSFQFANSAPPLCVTDRAIAPAARILDCGNVILWRSMTQNNCVSLRGNCSVSQASFKA